MAASLPLLVPTPGHAPLVGTGAAASGADEALQQSPYGHVAAELVRPKPKRPRKGVRDPLAQHGYTTLGPIARGAFATVTKAVVKSTGEEVAVKSFLKKRKSTATPGEMALGMTRTVEDDVVKGTRELEVLRLLAAQASLHPGVAHLLEVVESSRAVHAVLEYCAGGSLSFLLSSRPVCSGLQEEQAAGLFAQACRAYGNTPCRPVCSWLIRDGPIIAQANSAVAHLHGVGVAHRDVKPANLLFVDGRHAHGTCTACAPRVHGACAACACGMCTAPRPPAARGMCTAPAPACCSPPACSS